MITIILLQLFS